MVFGRNNIVRGTCPHVPRLTADVDIRRTLLICQAIFLCICCLPLTAQDKTENNIAYYEGEVYTYLMSNPEGWLIDLENAENDGYTAAIYPDSQSYFEYTMKIRIGIFKNGKRTFDEFIADDTVYLIKKIENIEFIQTDTLIYSSGIQAIIFETEDPGGEYELAMIAYFDMKTETVVYELLISNREHFIEGETKFHNALDRFSIGRAE